MMIFMRATSPAIRMDPYHPQPNLHNILPLISNNTRNPSCKTDLVAMTNWPCQVAPHYQVAPYYR